MSESPPSNKIPSKWDIVSDGKNNTSIGKKFIALEDGSVAEAPEGVRDAKDFREYQKEQLPETYGDYEIWQRSLKVPETYDYDRWWRRLDEKQQLQYLVDLKLGGAESVHGIGDGAKEWLQGNSSYLETELGAKLADELKRIAYEEAKKADEATKAIGAERAKIAAETEQAKKAQQEEEERLKREIEENLPLHRRLLAIARRRKSEARQKRAKAILARKKEVAKRISIIKRFFFGGPPPTENAA
jgi:hypothetical protein